MFTIKSHISYCLVIWFKQFAIDNVTYAVGLPIEIVIYLETKYDVPHL